MEILYRFTDDGFTGIGGGQYVAFIALAVSSIYATSAFITYRRKPNLYQKRGVAGVAALFSLALSAFIIFNTYEQFTIWQAYNTNQFETINGCVHNVSEAVNGSSHKLSEDTFNVSGRQLTINSNPWVRGYHETLYKGGPLKNGTHVKISLLRGKIIEIARLPGSCT